MSELRVGLVGAGMVAAYHRAAWAACHDARLVAIADPNVAAAHALAEGSIEVFPSLRAMLGEAQVDAIDIAAPVTTHAALVSEAASAELPVLCQKPLALTAEEAQTLVDALPNGARVMLHENWRWRPSYRSIKDRLRDLPHPCSFAFRTESSGLCQRPDGSYPALLRQPFLAHLNRLIVFELLGHHLDVLAFLFGPVDILDAQTERRCPAVSGEDFARIDLTAGSTVGTLTGNLTAPEAPPRPSDMLVLDGQVVLSDWHLDLPGVAQEWDHATAYQQSYDDCIAHFASCVIDGRRFETPLECGVTLLQWIEKIYGMARG